MRYIDLKQKHREEFNGFPIFFAFSDKQMEEGLKKWDVKPGDLLRTPGGGFIRESDQDRLFEMLTRHNIEMASALDDDDFLVDAIRYELGNHEYCITRDYTEAFNAIGIEMDPRVKACFEIARQHYWKECREEE